jgi:hypothetical protein
VNFDFQGQFRDSGILSDTLYYNIGGFVNIGHGPRHAAYNVSKSYQICGNITKELGDGKGYLRLLFKVADTQEPNDTGGIACGNITGAPAGAARSAIFRLAAISTRASNRSIRSTMPRSNMSMLTARAS